MITYVQFLADVPIQHMGFATSRLFTRAGGWDFKLVPNGICLSHHETGSFVVYGVGFVVHENPATQTFPAAQPVPIQRVNTKKGKAT